MGLPFFGIWNLGKIKRHKKNKPIFIDLFTFFVRPKGLEPPRLTAPDPKSGVATNYTTSAFFTILDCKSRKNFQKIKIKS